MTATKIRFFQSHFMQLVSGLMLAFIVATTGRAVYDFWVDAQPTSSIFAADVIVPDFRAGENPLVDYNRSIRRSFVGDYEVEVKQLNGAATFCTGNAENISYKKDEPLDPSIASLSWYVYNACSMRLIPGKYYLETNYTIHIPNESTRYMTTNSNVFTVSP